MRNHLWEDATILRERGRLVKKINITFFVENEVLNIFHSTIFSKKIIFSKVTAENFFFGRGGMNIFEDFQTLKAFFSKLCFLTSQL